MALTNILREPRREITETLLGLAIIIPALIADYNAALWFEQATVEPGHPDGLMWPVGMVIIPFITVLSVILLLIIACVTHSIGEGICAALRRIGLDPRPRQRYINVD